MWTRMPTLGSCVPYRYGLSQGNSEFPKWKIRGASGVVWIPCAGKWGLGRWASSNALESLKSIRTGQVTDNERWQRDKDKRISESMPAEDDCHSKAKTQSRAALGPAGCQSRPISKR